MKHPPVLEVSDVIAVLRLAGKYSFESAVQLVSSAIAQAVAQEYESLLVDCIDIAGFHPPSIPARHEMVRQWATVAQSQVRIAFVICRAFIDPEKFGVAAAANFGLVGNVFETEADARDWLRMSARDSAVRQAD